MPIGAEIEPTTAARPGLMQRLSMQRLWVQRLEVTPALALFVVALPVLFLHAAFQSAFSAVVHSKIARIELRDASGSVVNPPPGCVSL